MRRAAQSTLEYDYLVAIVAAVIIVIAVYVSRGFQGRLRVQADQLGEQYSAKNMSIQINRNSIVEYDDYANNKTKVSTSDTNTVTTTKSGSFEKTPGLKNESW